MTTVLGWGVCLLAAYWVLAFLAAITRPTRYRWARRRALARGHKLAAYELIGFEIDNPWGPPEDRRMKAVVGMYLSPLATTEDIMVARAEFTRTLRQQCDARVKWPPIEERT